MIKRLKNLNKKFVVGVLSAVILFSGTGFVFANSDAGEHLRAWYDGKFNQTVDDITEDVNAYGESKIPGLDEEYEALKSEVELDIDLTRIEETNASLEEIIQAKLAHIEDLDAAQAEILGNIGLEFFNVFLDGTFEINRLKAEGLEFAEDDLTALTDDLGNEAIEDLTTDLNTATDDAVEELEDAVARAQEELSAALLDHQETTTRNLENQVDWAIEDLREEVIALLTDLVEEQQDLITATAEQLTDDAKAALDDVVSDINE